MLNAKALIGTHDVLFVVFDTLRYDVAQAEHRAGRTPTLSSMLPAGGWELRHTPASFTYAAHHAFFAGFLPTPASPGPHPRLFATSFPGSESTGEHTAVFDAPDIVRGFSRAGYHTICIGGVGFFNPASPLGRVLPSYFEEAHFSAELGVTDPASTKHQVDLAIARLGAPPASKRVFLFVNVSALHQPNYFYLEGATTDSIESHAAALRYVDPHLRRLVDALRERAPTLCILSSDHGTAYGEDGHIGHRHAHPVVWNVPYAELVLPRLAETRLRDPHLLEAREPSR